MEKIIVVPNGEIQKSIEGKKKKKMKQLQYETKQNGRKYLLFENI